MTKEQFLEIAQFLSGLIKGSEWENHLFVVGGAVRSFVMSDNIKDIDLVIDLPDGGIRFGRWIQENGHTHKTVVEYERFGVTMFHLDAFPEEDIECVYTRCEKYLDRSSRNPETEFGTLEEDAFRRDFTINSLYFNVSNGEILDLTGKGREDIENKVVRVTSNPDIIFDDDPLRILRAIRFSARFGFEIEEATLQGMKEHAHRLPMLSQERVTDELSKMLVSDRPVQAMKLLEQIGALQFVLPEFVETVDMKQNKFHDSTVWEHTLKVLGNVKSKELSVRLAALFHDIGKVKTRTVSENGDVHFINHEVASGEMAEKILKRMKFSNAMVQEVVFLAKNHMRLKHYGDSLSSMRPKRLRKFLFMAGNKERFLRLADLIHADNNAHAEGHCMPNQVPLLLELAKEEERMFGFKLPINGFDVLENCKFEHKSDMKLIFEHALKLAFANPELTKEDMLKELKHFKIQSKNP